MLVSSGQISTLLKALEGPTKSYLEERVKELGYDPQVLSLVIDRAIKLSIEETEKSWKEKELATNEPRFLRAMMENVAYDYIVLVLSQTEKWKKLQDRIKAYGAVIVVGAGISFETGVPLTSTLDDILKFCHSRSYASLRRDAKMCLKFKRKFKEVCDGKQPGVSHEVIVNNFPKYIYEIICLNWDNLLERAAFKLGRAVPKISEDFNIQNGSQYLWKFHGDVENIKQDNRKGKGGWIFPDENGFVFNSFKNYSQKGKMKDQLFTLIVVGYGERDKKISKEIIDLLENTPPRPTFRIVLDLKHLDDDNYIVGPSDFILPRIFPS